MRAFLLFLCLWALPAIGADIESLRKAGCPAIFVSAVQTVAQYSTAGDVSDELWELMRASSLTREQEKELRRALRQIQTDKRAWNEALILLRRYWETIEDLAALKAEAIFGNSDVPVEHVLDLDIPELEGSDSEYAERLARLTGGAMDPEILDEAFEGFADVTAESILEDVLNVRVEQNLDSMTLGPRPRTSPAIEALTREAPVSDVVVVFQQKLELQRQTGDFLDGNARLSAVPTLVMADIEPELRLVDDELREQAHLVRYNERVEGLFPEIRLNTENIHCMGNTGNMVFASALSEFVRVSLLKHDEVHVHLNLDLSFGMLAGERGSVSDDLTTGEYLRKRGATERRRLVGEAISKIAEKELFYRPLPVSGSQDGLTVVTDGGVGIYTRSYLERNGEKKIIFHAAIGLED